MDEKLTTLRAVPLFVGLDDNELKAVGALCDEVDLPAGHEFTHEETSGTSLHDRPRRCPIDRGGATIRTSAGDFMGEIALLDHGRRTVSATSETPCRLLVLGHRESTLAARCSTRHPGPRPQGAGPPRPPALPGLGHLGTTAAGTPGRDRLRPTDRRRDPLRNHPGSEGITHLVVGPCLGEHDPTDRAVRQHQRAAAVAAIDVQADFDDVAAHV